MDLVKIILSYKSSTVYSNSESQHNYDMIKLKSRKFICVLYYAMQKLLFPFNFISSFFYFPHSTVSITINKGSLGVLIDFHLLYFKLNLFSKYTWITPHF